MTKTYLTLKPSEQVVASVAGRIFAAYIAAGMVSAGNESEWLQRSLREAIELAKMTDEAITSEGEMS